MKIAVITSGILPVPAVQGGAVENLIDYYLEYNELHHLHDITVYSVWHPDIVKHEALKSEVNHYEYFKTHSLWFRFCAKIYGLLHQDCYYFYQLEYFFECVIRKILRKQYDLIILENRPWLAIKLSQLCKTPIISHIHTNLVNRETEQKKAIIQATSKFLVVSEYIKKEIESIDIKTNIQVVYNGLNPKQFNKDNIIPIPRSRYGFDEDDFVVIYTGRIVPQKGVKELLQAFQLLKEHKDIKLLVVGGDNFGDSVKSNVFLDELHNMAKEMDGKVKFTGFVPYSQLPAYLILANVAVVPSHINEALGMSSIEAIAMGLPVIATNDGGIPETLVNQHHILMDKKGELAEQIANAILEIKKNPGSYAGNSLPNRFKYSSYTESFFNAVGSIINAKS